MAEGKKKMTVTDDSDNSEKDQYIEGLKRRGEWGTISKKARGGHPGAIKAMAEQNNAAGASKQDGKKAKNK